MAENFLRQSQLITTYGPGAMIDLPDDSVIVSGLQDWSSVRRVRIDEPRLTAKLKHILDAQSIDLFSPPRHEENAQVPAPVAARIFPTWFIVKDAKPSPGNPQWRRRRLVRWDHLHRRRFKDPDDGKRHPVVPVRFVCGCRRGHIDDLDWTAFIHGAGNVCHRPLWLEERGTSGDIGDTFAVCECGTERPLFTALGTDTTPLGQCAGKRPWIGQFAAEKCGEPYRLLVRTASNAYFAQTMSVISLPEFDEGLAAKVRKTYDRLKTLEDVQMLPSFRSSAELAAEFDGIADEDVIAEYQRQKGGDAALGKEVPVKVAEFRILDKGEACIGHDAPDSKFHAESLKRSEWDAAGDALLRGIDKLVLVHRLREVAALLGFTRFEAVSPDKDGEINLEVERAALAETISWLPAIENRGEGVFLSFEKDAIEDWLARDGTKERGERLESGWRRWAAERKLTTAVFPGVPYVMLHSLSHMLMTSISLDCGYPASSLRERIYAGEDGYGILIYTGSSDSEGTLGGLVEAGRRLKDHLHVALRSSLLCSNDPVCAEHRPDTSHEAKPLQGAACHGCLLIAETSCEQRNDFLDRALVIPTVGTNAASFFAAADVSP